MTTLTEFLLARITEDEQRLDVPDFVEVDSARGPGWGSRGDCPVCDAPQWDGSEAVTEEAWWEHAERTHQRSRVLAECEAKRRIVKLHSIGDGGIGKNGHWNEATQTMEPRQYWYCGNCDYDRDYGFVGDEKEGCETLLLLAGVYSDHPDFDESWAISE